MGRRTVIDRDRVLAVAEELVAARGAGALTIDAVAKAAGISKGGVQSCFGTKEQMLEAMLARWMAGDEQLFHDVLGDGTGPLDRVRAHVETTLRHDAASHSRAASLLAVLVQAPGHLAPAWDWYAGRLAGLDGGDPAARRARLAFLACEGAFFLRFFQLHRIDQAGWEALFDDIKALLQEA